MDDLISRQSVLDYIDRMPSELTEDGRRMIRRTRLIEYIRDSIPSAQPERKKGRWERHYSRPNVYADLYWHCSACGYKNNDEYANVYHRYCPNCGAAMEGERMEEWL